MPSVTAAFNQALGPIFEFYVGVTEARRAALVAAGQPVPSWVKARLLIDSGASSTCLDPSIIQPLGLTPTGSTSVQTPSTNGVPHQMMMYDVQLVVLHTLQSRFFDALAVMECGLASQGIDGLLGRDVLEKCVFIINGEEGSMTLCF
jgi:predicted aspartyl protease